MQFEYFPHFKDGKLSTAFIKEIERDFSFLEREKVFRISVEINKSKRSLAQNRLYWKWVTILAEHTGHDKDDIHDVIKFKFLREERVDFDTGEVFYVLGSTAKLNKTQFSELADKVYRWALQKFNAVLPLPDSQWEQQFKTK